MAPATRASNRPGHRSGRRGRHLEPRGIARLRTTSIDERLRSLAAFPSAHKKPRHSAPGRGALAGQSVPLNWALVVLDSHVSRESRRQALKILPAKNNERSARFALNVNLQLRSASVLVCTSEDPRVGACEEAGRPESGRFAPCVKIRFAHRACQPAPTRATPGSAPRSAHSFRLGVVL